MTSSSVNVATMTRVGGLGESAIASCVVAVPGPTAAVPGPGSEVPGPGATTAVPGPVVEVPVPPAGFLQSDPAVWRRRYEDGIRLWRWLDGRLEEALEGDASQYGLSGGADPC